MWTFDSWQKVAGNEAQPAPKVTAADYIYKLTPLAKLIFVLRNPTDRSAHWWIWGRVILGHGHLD